MILSRGQSEVGSLRSCSTFLPHPTHVPVERTSKTKSNCFLNIASVSKGRARHLVGREIVEITFCSVDSIV